jgi:hypothetical protein
MPNWKRFTSTSGAKIDVNLDAVAYLDPAPHGATVHFAVPGAGDSKPFNLSVRESPDGIHAAPAPS